LGGVFETVRKEEVLPLLARSLVDVISSMKDHPKRDGRKCSSF